MATITIPGMFLSGTHASRPAANAVGGGTLYAETDTGQTYQSDGSSTWTAWGAAAGANYSGVKWTSGTSMPGSPATNDRITRTDLGLDFYYDGTRWLSDTLYRETIGPSEIVPMPFPALTLCGRWTPWATDYDLWLVALYATTYVATNNGTNYHTVALKKAIAAGTETSIVTFNTSADTAGNYTTHVATIGAALGTTNKSVHLETNAATGAPTNIYLYGAVAYRLIGV